MNVSTSSKVTTNILIVDDNHSNLQILLEILTANDYKVRIARNGPTAILSAQTKAPDLILLDINMPGMNGFEACIELKKDPRTRDIPVIFLSGLSDTASKVTGFQVGGVDYVTKPVQAEELLARVSTHLTISDLQSNLKRQIAEKDHLIAELDAFARTVAHDIANPMTGLLMSVDVLQMSLDKHLPSAEKQVYTRINTIREAGQKINNIVKELVLLAQIRKQDIDLYPLQMSYIVDEAQKRLEHLIIEYSASLQVQSNWPRALGYAPWVEEIWVNYISNGLKYGGTPPILEIGAEETADGMARFWIKDNGNGIPESDQAAIFTEFTRLNQTRATGYGLGLSIVHRISEKLEGRVGVESTVGEGSRFYFDLPLS